MAFGLHRHCLYVLTAGTIPFVNKNIDQERKAYGMSDVIIAFPTSPRPSNRFSQADIDELARWNAAARPSGYFLRATQDKDGVDGWIETAEDGTEYVSVEHETNYSRRSGAASFTITLLCGRWGLKDPHGTAEPRWFGTLRDALEPIARTIVAGFGDGAPETP
jgi:hypothetical protein